MGKRKTVYKSYNRLNRMVKEEENNCMSILSQLCRQIGLNYKIKMYKSITRGLLRLVVMVTNDWFDMYIRAWVPAAVCFS